MIIETKFPTQFNTFCEEHGIIHQKSVPYALRHNILAGKNNRTLVDMVNGMFMIHIYHIIEGGETFLTSCRLN